VIVLRYPFVKLLLLSVVFFDCVCLKTFAEMHHLLSEFGGKGLQEIRLNGAGRLSIPKHNNPSTLMNLSIYRNIWINGLGFYSPNLSGTLIRRLTHRRTQAWIVAGVDMVCLISERRD
jgi:hypothetical protein